MQGKYSFPKLLGIVSKNVYILLVYKRGLLASSLNESWLT